MKVQKDDNDRHYHELPKLDPSQLHFVGDIGNNCSCIVDLP